MFLNSTILLIYLCWSQSISKMSSPYGPKAASLYSCPCVPISSNLSKLRAISIEHSSSYPCGSISIEQASCIVCPCGSSRTKNRSSAAGVDLWWSANHIAKRFEHRVGRLAHPLSPEGKGCANECNESSLSNCRVQPTFSMRKGAWGKRWTLP